VSLAPVAVESPLGGLIQSIRGVVIAGGDQAATAEGVAGQLRSWVTRQDLLAADQCEPDPTHYRQHVLHVEPDGSFSVVALVWLPGQATPIHDHISWCVVGVHRGQELETRYRQVKADGESWLVERDECVNPTGSVAALTPPGDIHRVANAGEGLAISLHVYGADIGQLGSSIRRRYDLPVRAGPAAE
jgi:predicted metal-dependent enzyme (double-stranded beta helix superfamily)